VSVRSYRASMVLLERGRLQSWARGHLLDLRKRTADMDQSWKKRF